MKKITVGQKCADAIAKFGGSWTFIFCFAAFLSVWMILNTVMQKPFDMYPFILLNLFLSALASLQAPIIMMSQNRAAEIDREKAERDYKVNVKAEKEIQHIKAELDRLIEILEKRN